MENFDLGKLDINSKRQILVLQGVPASGKSAFARKLATEHPNWVIVNRDSMRKARGTYWLPSQENYIDELENSAIIFALKHDLNVIIDATNLNPKTIDKWNNIADNYASRIEFKLFKISYKEAMERDNNREDKVGEKVMRKFFRNYFPELLYNYTDDRIITLPSSDKESIILCDIDGTIALHNDRNPFDYNKASEDTFDPRMKVLLNGISQSYKIIFFSGRSEDAREVTHKWLEDNGFGEHQLYMRKHNDFRSDDIVKKEMYFEYIQPKYNVACVFDDRDKVVKMWRDLGILCCQVYYGDF
jgi:predicted kinase